MAGQQIEAVSVAWHVYTLTDSPLQLGLVGLFRVLPFLVLVLAGGAMADVVDRRKILRASQVAQIIALGTLTLSTGFDWVSTGLIYAVVTLSGTAATFDAPARQALIPQVVPRAELANAFTLNTLGREAAFVIGPLVAGVLIAQFGLATAYAAGALLHACAALTLLAIKAVPIPASGDSGGPLGGMRFLRGEPLLLVLLIVAVPQNLFGGLNVLLPMLARDVLLVGPDGLGLLHAARSAGAVIGGLAIGAAGQIPRPIATILTTTVVQGACLAALGASTGIWLSLGSLLLMGVLGVISEVARATIVVARTPDQLRGRVMALHQVVFVAGPQLGSVNIGALASVAGPAGAAAIGAAAIVGSVALAARSAVIRRSVAAER
jgi:MFS family permease